MEDTRIVIGFDLDDVLFDFIGPLIEWHNSTYGSTYTREDFFSYDFSKVWKCEGEDAIDRIWRFYHSEQHTQAQPLAGSVELLHTLKNKYRLVIITARPDSVEVMTRAWIDTYFYGVFESIVFANHFHNSSQKRTKSSICQELDVRLFVEDALHNAHDIAQSGIPVLLLDRPWNREEITGPITRVYSYETLFEAIETIKN